MREENLIFKKSRQGNLKLSKHTFTHEYGGFSIPRLMSPTEKTQFLPNLSTRTKYTVIEWISLVIGSKKATSA